ncbi:hypothetical protein HHI36_012874 [Cryptolaemus montrouzieri]|uniref:Anoctamin n=1 Tax=Cryptolaemus montrouzieri TaxID=559131 RepID=A0ABD2NG22_9CUCU
MDIEEEIEEKLFNLRKFRKDDNIEPIPYYFRDGERRIHYIIVLQDTAIYKKEVLRKVLDFLSFLEYQGLEFEFEIGVMDASLVFLKIHATDIVIKHFANVYDVDIDNAGHNFIPDDSCRCYFRMTKLTRDNDDVFRRKGSATSCEINLLLYKILSDPLTYDERDVYGIDKMIKLGFIKDAFPLHDGPWQWAEEKQENLNDRQILSKYWANFSMWYKEQPINLVSKYFGTDMAFFFAWCEYYNFMLIIVAIVGITFILINVLILVAAPSVVLPQFCNATDAMICPMCSSKMCHFVPVRNYCKTHRAEFVLGNYVNVIYAVFISIWVAAFLECWRRKECTLRVRWNVQHTDVEYKIRYDYKDKSTYRKKSMVTGKIEPYVPVGVKILRYSLIYFIVFLVLVLVSSYVILLVLMKNFLISLMESEPRRTLLTTVVYSICQVIFIKTFSMFYIKISMWLTYMEVPKTQKMYDDRVIYKIYLFGFINNYIPILYTAFLRGQLATLPGKKSVTHIFDEDFCLPSGCVILLSIQLLVVMSLKSFGGNIFTAIGRFIRQMLFAASQKKTVAETEMYVPVWEKEYYLEKSNKELWAFHFSEMILQFGYVSFFMAAFPLVGLIAVLNNFVEFRMTAIKLVRGNRRPVPNMIGGIGAWDDIIKFASYFSIICNAFMVAFNTRFIRSVVYSAVSEGGEEGLFNFTYSLYAVKDLPSKFHNIVDVDECFYFGLRHPPSHAKKYTFRDEHYMVLTWKFVFIIIFENLILMVIGGIYYFVDAMPEELKNNYTEKNYL